MRSKAAADLRLRTETRLENDRKALTTAVIAGIRDGTLPEHWKRARILTEKGSPRLTFEIELFLPLIRAGIPVDEAPSRARDSLSTFEVSLDLEQIQVLAERSEDSTRGESTAVSLLGTVHDPLEVLETSQRVIAGLDDPDQSKLLLHAIEIHQGSLQERATAKAVSKASANRIRLLELLLEKALEYRNSSINDLAQMVHRDLQARGGQQPELLRGGSVNNLNRIAKKHGLTSANIQGSAERFRETGQVPEPPNAD